MARRRDCGKHDCERSLALTVQIGVSKRGSCTRDQDALLNELVRVRIWRVLQLRIPHYGLHKVASIKN